ncbi:MAG: YceI family protein [Fluviicola sp.]
MKKNAFFAFCAAAFLMAACGGEESTENSDETGGKEEKEMTAESVTYTLDTENSTLNWEGFEGEHESHVGTLKFSEGGLMMQGNDLEEGLFVVDMTSITVMDEGMPEKSKKKLENHLGADDVWDIAQYATTSVKLEGYKDGKLDITLVVLGKELPATVPVSITTDEQGAKMTGDFTVDFSSLNIPLFEPQEEEDESISPVIQFGLNAVLKKK